MMQHTGKRIVRPDRTIRWDRVLWRTKNRSPEWLIPGRTVRVSYNSYRDYLWVRSIDGGWYSNGDRFVRESDWLPEGF